MLMADPNTKENRMKAKAGRVSSLLKTRESRLQNTCRRGASTYSSRDSRTEAVCARMSLLRIMTRFAWMSNAGAHRTDSWTTVIQHCLLEMVPLHRRDRVPNPALRTDVVAGAHCNIERVPEPNI